MKNRRMILRIIALVLAFLLVIGTVVSAIVALAEPSAADRNQYTLDIVLMEAQHALDIHQRTTYVNQTDRHLDAVTFHLYANAYRRLSTVPAEESILSDVFPAGYAPGGVDFYSVSVNGSAADWGVSGGSEQFLTVRCSIAPGQSAEFQFEYSVLLPSSLTATGVSDLSWRLTDFYPIAAVYDRVQGLFTGAAKGAVGSPHYSDVSDYTIRLSAPETYRLASSGTKSAAPIEGGWLLWTIQANSMRDAAIVLSRKYSQSSRISQRGTAINAFTTDRSAAGAMLDRASEVLDLFSAWFGDYPYPQLDIAQCEVPGGSASYPGVILVDPALLAGNRREDLNQAIARQVAAQWFAFVVGSDRNQEPWLSDALSAYSALLAIRHQKGGAAYLRALNAQALDSLRLTIPGGLYIDSPANRFIESSEYEIVVIDRGCAMLHWLSDAMGEEGAVFLRALRQYVEDNQMKNASIDDFSAALAAASGRSWDDYLITQFQEVGNSEYQHLERID